MKNQKNIIESYNQNNKNSKLIIPIMRKNKSMNLIFEKKNNILPLTDRNLMKITSINFMEKKEIENVSKKINISTEKDFHKLNSSSSLDYKKPNFLLSNYNSFHSHILHNRKKSMDINEKNERLILKNKILFHNKILREAIFKKDGKKFSNKKINTIHVPKIEITDDEHKYRIFQIQTRSPNFKLFKCKKIKVRDNFSLNIFLLPKN